jgi:hypothetical protein
MAIGMVNPGQPVKGFINSAKCFYRIHTHDESGIVHVEMNKTAAPGAAFIRFKDFLDIWGQKHTLTQFGPFKGSIHIYIGNESKLGQVKIGTYKPYTGSMNALLIRTHEVIWVEVGKSYYTPKQLPTVTFYM